mmetsp:Transcript_48699/g.137013  ORF Transcript_48699/g.137013 Transcript_48699/m.137013 type:complete len:211 (-) Transcript_48699:28-660(-)
MGARDRCELPHLQTVAADREGDIPLDHRGRRCHHQGGGDRRQRVADLVCEVLRIRLRKLQALPRSLPPLDAGDSHRERARDVARQRLPEHAAVYSLGAVVARALAGDQHDAAVPGLLRRGEADSGVKVAPREPVEVCGLGLRGRQDAHVGAGVAAARHVGGEAFRVRAHPGRGAGEPRRGRVVVQPRCLRLPHPRGRRRGEPHAQRQRAH